MRPDTLALGVLAVLAIGGVALGLLAVGGPGMGRIEQRDRTRLDDLRGLSAQVTCYATVTQRGLPDVIETDPPCAGEVRLTDPYTDAPYRYRRLSDTGFELCADFEAPDLLHGWTRETLNRKRGCLTLSWHR